MFSTCHSYGKDSYQPDSTPNNKIDSFYLNAGLNDLFFYVCERHVCILSKILTNASYTFIQEKNKQAEMGRKDFLCSCGTPSFI